MIENQDKDYWVTIAVPVYNVENYLERCVRSLFEQTYKNIKFDFVNDGSTDDSLGVLTRIVEEYPQRKPYVTIQSFPENKGLATVRNYLVDHCTTDWIIHVDSDDWIELDLVESFVKKQQLTGADMVVSGAVYHMKDGDYSARNTDSNLKSDYLELIMTNERCGTIWGRLIRLSLYTDHQLRLSTRYYNCEDLRMIVPLTYYAQCIASIRENGYHHVKQRENQISEMNAGKFHKMCKGVIGSQLEVRMFVKERMPEYLELYDTNRCMHGFEEYLTLSLLYGDKEMYHLARKHHQDVIHRYPFMRGGFADRMKRELKYHYWLAHPLIKMKFSLGSLF